jgi:hypothetical protein
LSIDEPFVVGDSIVGSAIFVASKTEQIVISDTVSAGVVSLRAVTDTNGIVSAQSSFIDAAAFLSDSIVSSTIEAVSVSFLVDYTETNEVISAEFGAANRIVSISDSIIGTDENDSTILFAPSVGKTVVASQVPVNKLMAEVQGNKYVTADINTPNRVVPLRGTPKRVVATQEIKRLKVN